MERVRVKRGYIPLERLRAEAGLLRDAEYEAARMRDTANNAAAAGNAIPDERAEKRTHDAAFPTRDALSGEEWYLVSECGCVCVCVLVAHWYLVSECGCVCVCAC